MTELTTKDPIRLVQVTDTHLYGEGSGTLLRMNTQESFDSVLELISQTEDSIDFILATGDIAQDASAGAYKQFLQSIVVLNTPFRWIAGNHDSAAIMQDIDAAASDKLVYINNWLLLFLDSSIEGQVHGRLNEAELEFLESTLHDAEHSSRVDHCLLCVHHNPVEGNAGWMKDIGLQNGDDLFALIKSFSKCRAIVYGHIHQELDYMHESIRCMCTPSTCIQFKPHVNNFALDRANPGYRSLLLHENGDIDSRVHRLREFDSGADFNSTGY